MVRESVAIGISGEQLVGGYGNRWEASYPIVIVVARGGDSENHVRATDANDTGRAGDRRISPGLSDASDDLGDDVIRADSQRRGTVDREGVGVEHQRTLGNHECRIYRILGQTDGVRTEIHRASDITFQFRGGCRAAGRQAVAAGQCAGILADTSNVAPAPMEISDELSMEPDTPKEMKPLVTTIGPVYVLTLCSLSP